MASNCTILSVNVEHPDAELLAQAAKVLLAGGLVVAPTETRYGLLAYAEMESAVERLYRAKGRPATLPTALFVRSREEMDHLGVLDTNARLLADTFLPGPLTLVVPSRLDWTAPRVTDGKIGLRWSTALLITALVELVGAPLTATSANRSGSGELETVEQIADVFGPSVDLYLDAGGLTGTVSTVVDCSAGQPQILRRGAIEEHDIWRTLGK